MSTTLNYRPRLFMRSPAHPRAAFDRRWRLRASCPVTRVSVMALIAVAGDVVVIVGETVMIVWPGAVFPPA
ncbi:MAG: hypothetical protein JO244_06645 [Solirubrobacterales bacterium]|nr:hypothetical protein [Solirubrobacterales bacterium]